MKVNLVDVRMGFPAIWHPQAFMDGEPKYGARFIIPPGSKAAKDLDAAVTKVAQEKWKDKAAGILKSIKNDAQKMCWLKEEYTNSSGEVYDGFEGMYHLNAKSDARPLVLDRDKSPLTEQDGRPYSGCYVVGVVEIWAQDNKWGKGIRCQLKGVQFYRDGDAFSGGTPASADDFEDLSEGIDADGEDEENPFG